MILSFITGTIGRYLILAVVGLGLVAWIRADAAAPYKAEAAALRQAAVRNEAIIAADTARAEADRAEIARLQSTVEAIANESRIAGACQLSPADIERLQSLAAGNH
jgi:hypothetical protein